MYYLGVDLGGTNIAIGLVDEAGKIIFKNSVPTFADRSGEEILKDIGVNCAKILKDNDIVLSDVKSIGIGCPGRCILDRKIIVYCPNIKSLNNMAIEPIINKYIDLPVYPENDANCAALAENIYGASKGSENSIIITLGTGIGAGIIVNKKLLNKGGEVGHHVIYPDGELCECGKKGCWEAYASATALIRQAKIAAIRFPNSKLNSGREIDAKLVFDIAEEGDYIAKKVIEGYIFFLADGISNLINILQPQIIVIGGGISAQGEKLLTPLREAVKNMVYAQVLETDIVQAQLGNDAGIIGAAMLGSTQK